MDTAIKTHLSDVGHKAGSLLVVLLLFETGMVLVYLLDVFAGMPRPIHILFDLDAEKTIPSWFSSIQLFLIGLILLLSRFWPNKPRTDTPLFFPLTGSGFIFLAVDEAVELHEAVTDILKHVAWIPRFQGNHGIWIPVYLIVMVFLAFLFRRSIVALARAYPRRIRIVLTGLVVFLIGAVGLEIIGYQYLRALGQDSIWYKLEIALEEFLEMAGASIVLYGVLSSALGAPELPKGGIPSA